MKKRQVQVMTVILFAAMLAALICLQTEFSFLSIYENGIDKGNGLYQIEQGWEYTINEGETRYQTELPCVLELPKDAERLTFYNVIPADVTDGDVLRLQTQLGAYQVFVDGRLIDENGQDATEKTYLYDCATAVLFGKLTGEDGGKELRIETTNLYPQYLAMQRAPYIGNHRDVLMNDVIDGAGGLLVILVSTILVAVYLLQYVFFLLKRQNYPVLLLSAAFLICLTLYYNTGNFFRLELWGYPKELFPANDFIYYALQAFIPILGYLVLLVGWKGIKLPRPLHALMCIHTVCGVAAVSLQMLWVLPYIYAEKPLILLTLVCYGWITLCICPWRKDSQTRWFVMPLLLCVFAFLLDYYKSSGIWFPFPKEFTAWFQMDLPFMVFLPPMMLLYGVVVMFGVVQWQSEERVRLTFMAEQAEERFRLMEAQYAYMDENQQQIRQLRHDMLHHVRVASGLLAEGQTEAVQKYLERIGEMVTMPDLGQYCVSRTGNITINWFAREADRLGVGFHCEADIPAERQEYSADLCIVLANALQNALEASRMVKDPYINIVAAKQGQALLLRVENRFDGKLHYGEDGRILSRKKEPGHGMGLAGIKQVTEKHSGYFKTNKEAGIFYLEAVLNHLFLDV